MATKVLPAGAIAIQDPHQGFTQAQIDQLLKPIHPKRVLEAQGHSHVSQQDILAHLTRIFGFGNFDIDIKNVELVFETERGNDRFDVCYKALVRLTIRDPFGNEICHYENGSMETSQNQRRGDGHDLAYKSAISLSVKRAAIALGDQFGLSLYNKGQKAALVISTIVNGNAGTGDVQADVPQQVSLGNDEKEAPAEVADTPKIAPVVAIAEPKPVEGKVTPTEAKKAPEGLLVSVYQAIKEATELEPLRAIWVRNANYLDEGFEADGFIFTLRALIENRKDEIGRSK